MRAISERAISRLFVLGLLLLAVNALLAWRNTGRVLENNRHVIESRGVLAEVRGLFSTLKDAETGQRGYILTGRDDYLAPYLDASRQYPKSLQRLRVLLRARPDQQPALDVLQTQIPRKFAEMERALQLRRTQGLAASRRYIMTDRGKEAMDAIRATIARMERRENRVAQERDLESNDSALQTARIFAVAAFTDFALLGLTFRLVRRDQRERRRFETRMIRARDESERLRSVAEQGSRGAEVARAHADDARVIAENARLQAEELRAQAEAANQAKSDFIAGISHELRTPLNAINGFSKLLLNPRVGPLNEDQDAYVRDVLASGEHLLSLINDLLDLSKIEAGKLKFDPALFSVGETLETSLSVVRERARAHNIALELEISPIVRDLSPVWGDRRKVRQILFNLLSNAVKFTPDGGRVTLMAQMQPEPSNNTSFQDQNPHPQDQIVISVADTGIGIAPQDLPRIWGAFEQVDGTYTRQQQGTGLGLTLTKRMVELHGGQITVESEVGRGSIFRVALPLRFGPDEAAAPDLISSVSDDLALTSGDIIAKGRA